MLRPTGLTFSNDQVVALKEIISDLATALQHIREQVSNKRQLTRQIRLKMHKMCRFFATVLNLVLYRSMQINPMLALAAKFRSVVGGTAPTLRTMCSPSDNWE